MRPDPKAEFGVLFGLWPVPQEWPVRGEVRNDLQRFCICKGIQDALIFHCIAGSSLTVRAKAFFLKFFCCDGTSSALALLQMSRLRRCQMSRKLSRHTEQFLYHHDWSPKSTNFLPSEEERPFTSLKPIPSPFEQRTGPEQPTTSFSLAVPGRP